MKRNLQKVPILSLQKGEINLFGGLLDIYPTVLFRKVFNCRMAIGNRLIKLRMPPCSRRADDSGRNAALDPDDYGPILSISAYVSCRAENSFLPGSPLVLPRYQEGMVEMVSRMAE